MCREYEQMIEEGRLERSRMIAQKVLALGKLTLEEIAECSGLPLEEVERLRDGLARQTA